MIVVWIRRRARQILRHQHSDNGYYTSNSQVCYTKKKNYSDVLIHLKRSVGEGGWIPAYFCFEFFLEDLAGLTLMYRLTRQTIQAPTCVAEEGRYVIFERAPTCAVRRHAVITLWRLALCFACTQSKMFLISFLGNQLEVFSEHFI